MSKLQRTCAGLNCPERRSVCCNAKPTEQATKNGGYFICSKCRKQYQGGECTAGDTKEESWEKDVKNLREELDELFPKDQEAIDGIRPSKSNRSAALVLNAKWHSILLKSNEEWRKKLTEHGLDMYAQGQWENAQHEIHKVKQELLENIQNLDWITSIDDVINLIKGK